LASGFLKEKNINISADINSVVIVVV
jgi:hypothetical protein